MFKVEKSYLQGAYSFQQALLDSSSYAHHLAGSFHLGAQGVICIGELIKGEPWHFCYHIVKGRFKGRRGICDLYLIKGHSHAYFCRNSCYGVSACF